MPIRIFTSGLFILLLIEGSFRLLENAEIKQRRLLETDIVPDAELEFRMRPHSPGHDANGFRNPAVPIEADVVVLGDSQTWGVNVSREESYPMQLAGVSSGRVYQMAMGGYGTAQYWALSKEALKLSPRSIVVGLYLGNDIWDTYRAVYQNEKYEHLRRTAPELREDAVGPRAQSLWDEEKRFLNRYGRRDVTRWPLWLRAHSALGRRFDRAQLWPESADAWYLVSKAWASAHPDEGAFAEDRNVATVFTTRYRLLAVDLDDPRIAEGLRVTLELLVRMRERVEEAGVDLLVLVIPTKESVYAVADRVTDGREKPLFRRLVTMEERIRSELMAHCRTNRIACIDALPFLARELKTGRKLYPSDTDGHPLSAGYGILASVCHGALSEPR